MSVKNLSKISGTKASDNKTDKALTPVSVIALSTNIKKRVEEIQTEFKRVQQQFQQEMNTMLVCFAEGAGMTDDQYFQMTMDGQSIEIYEKQV